MGRIPWVTGRSNGPIEWESGAIELRHPLQYAIGCIVHGFESPP
ncbi:MAG: hypothetical protein SWY16_06400 [Cyanobacteriota bacterium]|nr:hypothetical protein [Cyanobacteriota bacterium]